MSSKRKTAKRKVAAPKAKSAARKSAGARKAKTSAGTKAKTAKRAVAKKTGTRSAAKRPAAKKAAARKTPAARKRSTARKTPAARKKPAARKMPTAQEPAAAPTQESPAPAQPLATDEVELSGVWGTVRYSESDPDAEVREIFNHYDRDKSGQINASELARILEALGMELEEHELKVALLDVDRDHDGKVNWDEFVTWWRSMAS